MPFRVRGMNLVPKWEYVVLFGGSLWETHAAFSQQATNDDILYPDTQYTFGSTILFFHSCVRSRAENHPNSIPARLLSACVPVACLCVHASADAARRT